MFFRATRCILGVSVQAGDAFTCILLSSCAQCWPCLHARLFHSTDLEGCVTPPVTSTVTRHLGMDPWLRVVSQAPHHVQPSPAALELELRTVRCFMATSTGCSNDGGQQFECSQALQNRIRWIAALMKAGDGRRGRRKTSGMGIVAPSGQGVPADFVVLKSTWATEPCLALLL